MNPGLGRRQRLALRRLERQLQEQDPALAALLSGGRRYVLPPLRFRTLPPAGYAVIGLLFLLPGMYLGVGSSIFAGLLALVAAGLRLGLARGEAPPAVPRHGHPGHSDRSG